MTEVLHDGKPAPKQIVSIYGDGARYSDKKIFAEVTADGMGSSRSSPTSPALTSQWLAIDRRLQQTD